MTATAIQTRDLRPGTRLRLAADVLCGATHNDAGRIFLGPAEAGEYEVARRNQTPIGPVLVLLSLPARGGELYDEHWVHVSLSDALAKFERVEREARS